MLLSNKSNTLSVLLYCILTIILLSCGRETTSSKNDIHGTVHRDGNGLAITFASPGDLANALIGKYTLQAKATVPGKTYILNVNPDTNEISGTIPDIPPGTHTLQVTYFIFTTEEVILCTFTKEVTVTAGQQSDVIIGDSDLDRNHHNDNDGYTNLEEIKMDTDPLDPDDYPVTPPGPPSNVIATAGDKEVKLSWSSVANATNYRVYRNIVPGVSKTNYIDDIITSSTLYNWTGIVNDAPLENGTTYYFIVTALNSNGESTESVEVNATPQSSGSSPSRPTNVNALAGYEEVIFFWDSVAGASSYNVYRNIVPGVSKLNYIDSISTSSTLYTWTGIENGAPLENGITYYFTVTAVNMYGESVESEEVNATPNILGFTDNGNGTVTDSFTGLMWQQEDDNQIYNWYEASGTYDSLNNPDSTDVCGNLILAGNTDWRLPTKEELAGLVYCGPDSTINVWPMPEEDSCANYGAYLAPTIGINYFPTTKHEYYWSSTKDADDLINAWDVDFSDGSVVSSEKYWDDFVRCVREGQ